MIIVTSLTFATIYKGIASAKYAVYVLVPLPYFLLTVLLIKGMTLEGHTVGWTYLFSPDWSKLFTLKIWSDAASQVLFSSGLAQITVIKFASHRNDDDPLLMSTILLPLMNFATSIFAAVSLFSFIGYASHHTGIPINDLPLSGMDLTFVVYPALLNTLPFPQIWAVIFFLMMVMLGLGSEYIYIECLSALAHGTLSQRFNLKYSPKQFTFFICCVILLINCVIFASSSGYFWLEMVDHYASGVNLIIFLFLQLIVFVYLLPLEDLKDRVNLYGEKFPDLYEIPLKIICPIFALLLAAITIMNEIKSPTTTGSAVGDFLGYSIMATPTIMLLIFLFIDCRKRN